MHRRPRWWRATFVVAPFPSSMVPGVSQHQEESRQEEQQRV